MRQIVLQDAGQDIFPRVSENCLYPDINDNYDTLDYEGERLVVRTSQVAGFRQLSQMTAGAQGMAIYGDILVRMANGGTHRIYRLSSGGVPTEVSTFSAATGHSNSLQFAPTKANNQAYPYLYVAYLDKKCVVLSIDASFAVTIMQTITLGITSLADGNVQIGDDGYIWYGRLDDNGHAHFIKFRRVDVTEGDVTLTEDDILDEWYTQESYPSTGSEYTWQGMKVKFGKVWFLYGNSVNSANRGFVVYDTITHAFVTKINLTAIISTEPEDFDFWDNSLLMGTYSSELYQMQF